MSAVVAWIVAHWGELVGVLGAVLTLASFITALTKTPKDDEVVRRIAAFLSFLQPRTSSGTLKLPGTAPAPDVSDAPMSRLEDRSGDDDEPRRLGF